MELFLYFEYFKNIFNILKISIFYIMLYKRQNEKLKTKNNETSKEIHTSTNEIYNTLQSFK